MKKRWGKPITQVQRFVPQEFFAACYEYELAVVDAQIDKTNVRYDFDGDNKYDSVDEGSAMWGTANYLPSTPVTNVEEITYSDRWYLRLHNVDGQYKKNGILNADYYSLYTPPYPIYKLKRAGTNNTHTLFTGTKSQS